MSESEELSRLISLIYDAALDSGVWLAALEETAQFLRSATATLGSYDALQSNAVYNFSWGDDPAYTALYVERYAKLNPFLPASLEMAVGDVATVSTFMSEAELFATQVYQEWAKPQGYIDIAQAVLEKSGTAFAVLVAVRHESVGRVDDIMRRRLALLVPHFRRSVLIGKVIDLKTVQAAAFAESIDGLAAGVFLVGANGNVVHANASARTLLEDGDVIRLTSGTLAGVDGVADRSLREALVAAGGLEAELAGRGIGISLTGSSGKSYMAHVLPLASGRRREAALSQGAAAAIFVRKAVLDLTTAAEIMVERYRLTPAELKVFRATVELGGVAKVAAALTLSEATVKTHLNRLFHKTGSRRQADLVRLATSLADPLGR